jgi:hypothetical protein
MTAVNKEPLPFAGRGWGGGVDSAPAGRSRKALITFFRVDTPIPCPFPARGKGFVWVAPT